MKRPILAATGAALIVAATIGAPQTAEAQSRYVAAGIIGGLSANAILGAGYPYYPGYVGYPAPVYYPAPAAYYRAPAYPPPGCVITQRPVHTGYGWSMRKIRVCY